MHTSQPSVKSQDPAGGATGGISFDIEHALKTRDEVVAGKVREAILRGVLKPGERIDENALADLLKVSRTPVRAGLRTLAAEGLVTIYPHRGTIVNELSLQEFEEIYFMRGILEGKAAFLAAAEMDGERIRGLRGILRQMEQSDNPDAWLELNAEFHHTIYAAAGRPRMLSIIRNMRNIAAPFIRQYICNRAYMDNALLEHWRILEACEKADGDLAQRGTETHLQTVLNTILQQVKGQPRDTQTHK